MAIYSARATTNALPSVQLDPFDENLREWLGEAAGPFANELSSDVTPQRVLVKLANSLAPVEARSWDAAIGLELALRAWLADLDPDAISPLAADVHELDDWLERSFDVEHPNRYHSPARFRPADSALTELLKRLPQGVTQMRTTR